MLHKTEDIFKLIKTMSKSEKGYFKKFVQGFSSGRENNYLLLFELLDKKNMPADKAVEQYFVASKKQVNVRALRRYLYQLLLKSLRLYHEKDNYRFDATNRVNEIEILMDKGFEEEAYQLSCESVEHCARYEMNELKLLFLGYTHLTFGDKIAWEDLPAERERRRKEIISTLKQVEYVTEIKHIELSVIYMANSFFPTRDKSKYAELETLVKHEALENEKALTALEAKLGFHNIWRSYYGLQGNTQKALGHARKIPLLIEEENAVNKSFMGRYVRGLLHLAKLTVDAENAEEAWSLLQKLRAIPLEAPGDKSWLEFTFIVGLVYFLKNYPNYLADAKKFANHAYAFITAESLNDAFRLSLVYDLSVYYFHLQDYNRALDLLGIILNRKPDGNRVIYLHSRLLQIVTHYEMGSKLLLPSLMKSAFRYMAKAGITFEFERIILRFFTRVLRPSNHVILSDELTWMKNEMHKSAISEFEKAPLKVFDYMGWLSKKAAAKS